MQNLVLAVDSAVGYELASAPLSHGPGAHGTLTYTITQGRESFVEVRVSNREVLASCWRINTYVHNT